MTHKVTSHLAVDSALSDMLCNPKVRDVLGEYELKSATEALSESLRVPYGFLDAESRRAAERRRATPGSSNRRGLAGAGSEEEIDRSEYLRSGSGNTGKKRK